MEVSPIDLEWYKIRDMLTGRNEIRQDVAKAFEMLKTCAHPKAQWVLANWAAIQTGESNDPQILCWHRILFRDCYGLAEALQASVEKCPFAQAILYSYTVGTDGFEYAYQSAKQGERDGYYALGAAYEIGIGCKKDLALAKLNFVYAASYGCRNAIIILVQNYTPHSIERWFWLEEAVRLGMEKLVLTQLTFVHSRIHDIQLYYAGKCMRLVSIDYKRGYLFGKACPSALAFLNATRALEFYTQQNAAARAAVDAWTLIARRLGVVKDMRRVIGLLIWNERDEW